MPCGHIMHSECLETWLKQTNSCPLCRHELDTGDAAYEKSKRERNVAAAGGGEGGGRGGDGGHSHDRGEQQQRASPGVISVHSAAAAQSPSSAGTAAASNAVFGIGAHNVSPGVARGGSASTGGTSTGSATTTPVRSSQPDRHPLDDLFSESSSPPAHVFAGLRRGFLDQSVRANAGAERPSPPVQSRNPPSSVSPEGRRYTVHSTQYTVHSTQYTAPATINIVTGVHEDVTGVHNYIALRFLKAPGRPVS